MIGLCSNFHGARLVRTMVLVEIILVKLEKESLIQQVLKVHSDS